MATLSSGSFSLAPTLGACYIGTVFAAILYGVTNVQTYMYYKRYKRDPTILKFLVFILWVLDGLHQAFITHAFYNYAIIDFADPLAAMVPEWSVMAHVFVGSTSDTIVRGLFCQRVFLLSGRNYLITVAIAIGTLVVFGSSYAFGIKGFSLSDYFDLTSITWFIYTSLISGIVTDLLIATSLCVLLSQRRTAFNRTNSVIRLLMIYSINTGALTTICSIICLVIYATKPISTKFVFIAVYFVLPKLYLNSLLATLNARQSLRDRKAYTSSGGSFPLNARPTGTGSNNGFSMKPDERIVEVQIQTTTDTLADPAFSPTGKGSEIWV
ncbi:uncharacterized protein FIBRA_06385 [Fibroporia radiculosa]|uniref:DUF6534 domain-containing protein n=1 Tax=Fibroporia radiculosa TaxID=599839 RepID=J4GBB9_9APHY|nr:uncharacterized protein FIBRA_06385 [Fibroporia radiculosa]CCM04218.1 predicted protein [Fibroporia radiculosa]